MKIPSRIKDILEAKPDIGRYALSKEADISEQEARFYCKLYKFSDNKPIRRGIALGDLHYPDHSPECLNIIQEFIDDFQPDHLLLTIGIAWVVSSISEWKMQRTSPPLGSNASSSSSSSMSDS